MTARQLKILVLPAFVIVSMWLPISHASHPIPGFDLSNGQKESLHKRLDLLDLFAMMNHVIYRDKTDAEIIESVRAKITENFKDPGSAQFRNEKVFRTRVQPLNLETGKNTDTPGIYVCGEVNGKNSFGAYVGYRNYWGGYSQIELEISESPYIFYWTLSHYCSRPVVP